MSRPLLLVFLLMVLVFTSQFEWRQQLSDMDTNPEESQKLQQIPKREEVVKEKLVRVESSSALVRAEKIKLVMDKAIERARTLNDIILTQEKKIQRLHEVVKSLKEQLKRCQVSNETLNGTLTSLAENSMELEQ
ncbi:hypothetical protein ACS0TY_026271 [Phlomoides rotata]